MNVADESVLLLVQGRVRPEAASLYDRYERAADYLMGLYHGEVVTTGGGIGSDYTTDSWPINRLLRFPSLAAAEGYLADPLHRRLERHYRDRACDELHVSLIAAAAPAR